MICWSARAKDPGALCGAKFDVNRSNESPLRDENADLRPLEYHQHLPRSLYNIAANPAGNQPIKETVKTWALSAAAAYFQERQSLAKFGAVRARMPKNIRDLTLLV